MIQDASPVRSGVPDCYKALYKIDVLGVTGPWNVNKERFPSGFAGGGTGPADGVNARTGVGLGAISFPPGQRVRGITSHYSSPANTNTNYREVELNAVNETLGTASFQLLTAAGAQTDPIAPTTQTSFDSTIWIELTLETV